MSRIQLNLPPAVRRAVKDLAKREGVSESQLIVLAVQEKVAALETAEYFRKRAVDSSRAELRRLLDKVPDSPPVPGDEIPLRLQSFARKIRSGKSR